MAQLYDFYCTECKTHLSMNDVRYYEADAAIKKAPSIAKIARAFVSVPSMLLSDTILDWEGTRVITLCGNDYRWFAEHGDHRLVPSVGDTLYDNCYNTIGCVLPYNHLGPCLMTVPRRE